MHRPLQGFTLGALLLTAATVSAEVREIPPEEMTETYIKDTTVIIQRRKPAEENTSKQTIRVDELDQPYSEGEQTSAALDSLPQTDNYQSEINNAELNAQAAYEFTSRSIDPSQAQREENLRSVMGLAPGTPIDYNNLSFPTDTAIGTIPVGISTEINPGQFEIVIPNTGNYAPQTHTTPNGEYQVNVTQDDITFRINLPNQ